jgi:hypothetical protein
MNVITKHDSHTIVYSSADASVVSGEWGNGQFTCQLLNVNRGGTHAVKVVPAKVLVPNVFENVSTGASSMSIFLPADLGGGLHNSGTIEPGHYVLSYLLRRLNLIHASIQFQYNADTYRVEVTNTSGGDLTLDISAPLAIRLGFTVPTVGVVGYTFVAVDSATTVAPSQPFMGTTPVVHVVAKKIANSNLLSSNSGEYNILATVDMTQTPYGAYASFTSPDIFLNDVDFRTPRSIGDVDFEILDSEFNPLYIDPRFHVIIQLKVYHVDTTK